MRYEDCVDRISTDHSEQLRNGSLVVGLDEAFQFHSPRFKNAAHKLAASSADTLESRAGDH